MNWVTYISGFLSALLATPLVIGIAGWFGKLWAERILEKDRAKYQRSMETLLTDLRTRDTKELLVHQLQFQKEFEVYKELWMAALRLARAGSHFRTLQFESPDSPEQIRQSLEESYSRLRDTVYDNRPFYASDVYDIAKAMLNGLNDVVRKSNRLNRLEQAGLSDAQIDRAYKMDSEIERKLNEINALLDELCVSIRSRVWSTNLSGWDRHDVSLV